MLKKIFAAGAALIFMSTASMAIACEQTLEQAQAEFAKVGGKFIVIDNPINVGAIKASWVKYVPDAEADMVKTVKIALGRVPNSPQMTNVGAIDKDNCVLRSAFVQTDFVEKLLGQES